MVYTGAPPKYQKKTNRRIKNAEIGKTAENGIKEVVVHAPILMLS